MGCGNEISDWDDKAVRDSMAGKNTEPDPKVFDSREAESYGKTKEYLEDKTNGFEDLKNNKGEVIITSDRVADSLARVELAQEMLKPTEHMRILEIRFSDMEDDFRGRSYATEEGNIIDIHRSNRDHVNASEVEHTIFHELGETYFKEVMINKNAVDEGGMRKNIESWENFLADAYMKNMENNELYPMNRVEKEGGVHGVQEHFGECFARYSGAILKDQMEHNKEAIAAFKNNYPDQFEFLENMRRELNHK